MTDISIAHVQAAVRHRNLGHRAIVALLASGGAIAVTAAVIEFWWQRAEDAVPATPGAGFWPDLATLVLGHFSFSFIVALAMAAVYELMVVRHVRRIARQVRSRGWLERGETVRLARDWMGSSDDLDSVVCALNVARDHGARTRSALTWQVARHRSSLDCQAADLRDLRSENVALKADLRAQAEYASLLAQALGDRPVPGEDASVAPAANVHLLAPANGSFVAAGTTDRQRLIGDFRLYTEAFQCGRAHEELALDDLVGDAVADLGDHIRKCGGSVEVGSLPVVWGDHRLLVRLFEILIGMRCCGGLCDGSPVVRITSIPLVGGRATIMLRAKTSRPPSGVGADSGPSGPGELAIDEDLARRLAGRIARAHDTEIVWNGDGRTSLTIEFSLPVA